jgi:hypothetical protein
MYRNRINREQYEQDGGQREHDHRPVREYHRANGRFRPQLVPGDEHRGCNNTYNSPSTATTIYPGVYYGGISVKGPLTMSPGVYILTNNGGSPRRAAAPIPSRAAATRPAAAPTLMPTGTVSRSI